MARDANLHKLNLSIHDIVQEEHRRQAGAQVTVGNIITSMRLLSTLEWRDFFETVSLIDRELAKDPARIYARMDFATRDRYRKVVERIGKRAKVREVDVARAALRLAEAAPKNGKESTQAHIGYFLIGRGLGQLESETSIARWLRAARTVAYSARFFSRLVDVLTALILGGRRGARATASCMSFWQSSFAACRPRHSRSALINWGVYKPPAPPLLAKLICPKVPLKRAYRGRAGDSFGVASLMK